MAQYYDTENLLGKRIDYIYMDEDKLYLCFVSGTESIFFEAVGDCCSTSWFETINNPEALIGNIVIEVDKRYPEAFNDIEMPDLGEGIVIQSYGFSIKTIQGHTDIEYRNESEGFYGGACIFRESTITDPENIGSDKIHVLFKAYTWSNETTTELKLLKVTQKGQND